MTAPPVSICWVHYRAEIIPHDVYIICFECKHVWTREKLEAAHEAILADIEANPIECPEWPEDWGDVGGLLVITPTLELSEPPQRPVPAEKIAACPACAHDF